MSIRELTVVALRVMAVGLLCLAIAMSASLFLSVIQWLLPGGWGLAVAQQDWAVSVVLSQGVVVVTLAAAALGLFQGAPLITRRILKDSAVAEPTVDVTSIRAGDLYHIATFVLGTYLVIDGLSRFLSLVSRLLVDASGSLYHATSLSGAVVYIVGGLFLMLGGQRIGEFFSRFKYDPENVPSQQFSIRLILIVVVAAAIIFGAIRLSQEWW